MSNPDYYQKELPKKHTDKERRPVPEQNENSFH